MATLGDRYKRAAQTVQEGVVLLMGSFKINGSAPTVLTGDLYGLTFTRAAAGRYTFTLPNLPFICDAGFGNVSAFTGNTEDVYVQVDTSTAATTGVITVHIKTAGTDTDPATNEIVQLLLVCRVTDRTAVS